MANNKQEVNNDAVAVAAATISGLGVILTTIIKFVILFFTWNKVLVPLFELPEMLWWHMALCELSMICVGSFFKSEIKGSN